MRKQALMSTLDKSENQAQQVVKKLIQQDTDFLDKEISNLTFDIKAKKRDLEDRLSEPVKIDESVVVNLYGAYLKSQEKLELFKSFKEFYNQQD